MIFIPNPVFRIKIREDLEKVLRKAFSNGVYTDKEKIVEILNFIYKFHYDQICNIIRGIDTKNIVSYLLFQYQLIEDNNLLKTNKDIDPIIFKETILYLLDLIAEKKACETSNTFYFYENEFFNRLWIHAENCIEYSNVSNLSHKICKKTSQIEILPEKSDYFLIHNLLNDFNKNFKEFQENVQSNIELREKYLNGKHLQDEILSLVKDDKNTGFKQEFGLTYLEFEFIILDAIKNCQKINTPQQIPCMSDTHINEISKHFNVSVENVEKLLSGITLGEEQFVNRKREIWDYVQQERSRKRPLIKINYDGKNWFLFSPKMLGNRICSISEDLVLSPQNRLPKEWNTNIINKRFSQINTKLGNWFEHKTIELLNTVCITGFKPSNKLRLDTYNSVRIDLNTGPPDFMGYSEKCNAVIVLECKLLDCVFEPKGIHGELSKFIYDKNSYVEKFCKKINWIIANWGNVKKAIEFQCRITIPKDCNIINYCFVTYYPTTIRYFYKEIPSPTLFELIELYNNHHEWPYKSGNKSISNETPTKNIVHLADSAKNEDNSNK
jgi:hypothetical protein